MWRLFAAMLIATTPLASTVSPGLASSAAAQPPSTIIAANRAVLAQTAERIEQRSNPRYAVKGKASCTIAIGQYYQGDVRLLNTGQKTVRVKHWLELENDKRPTDISTVTIKPGYKWSTHYHWRPKLYFNWQVIGQSKLHGKIKLFC